MSMKWAPERKDLGISCFLTLLFLIEFILPALCAYVLATIEVSDLVEASHVFSSVVPGSGVSNVFTHLFLSVSDSSFVLLLVDASLSQIYSTMLLISFARLYRTGLFRARAKAILAGLRKGTVPATFFFKAVAAVGAYVAVIPAAFRLQDVLCQHEVPLKLLGVGGVCLARGMFNAVVFHRDYAVPVLKDDSRFAAMRRRLALVCSGLFYAGGTALALLDGLFVSVALLTAASLSKVLAAGTALNAVQWTVMVVMQLTQPLVSFVLWDNYNRF